MNKITMTAEMGSVVAYRHADVPGLKVQTSPDCSTDPKSRWSVFASCEGVALQFFGGKSYASQKSAEKAIRAYLERRAENYEPAQRIAHFVPSTQDDVITW